MIENLILTEQIPALFMDTAMSGVGEETVYLLVGFEACPRIEIDFGGEVIFKKGNGDKRCYYMILESGYRARRQEVRRATDQDRFKILSETWHSMFITRREYGRRFLQGLIDRETSSEL